MSPFSSPLLFLILNSSYDEDQKRQAIVYERLNASSSLFLFAMAWKNGESQGSARGGVGRERERFFVV